jgi:RNA-directed DNA polymerase
MPIPFSDEIAGDLFLRLDVEYVDKYIENLQEKGLPIICETKHLAAFLGFREDFLFAVSAAPDKFYRKFVIKKRSGGAREINEPLPTLKEIQRFIIKEFFVNVKVHRSARAYKKNNTIRGNATVHRAQEQILRLDIKDFFPNLKSFHVYSAMYGLGYTSQVSRLLTGLVTLDNGLPQGAPTSPMLSNIILRDFDESVFEYCRSLGIRYTRYADDIFISGKIIDIKSIIKYVRTELQKLDLSLNERKTTVMRKGTRKIVTGVVVNEKISTPRLYRREIRKECYYIRKYGLEGHVQRNEIKNRNYLRHLIGKINFCLSIDRDDSLKQDLKYITALLKLTEED